MGPTALRPGGKKKNLSVFENKIPMKTLEGMLLSRGKSLESRLSTSYVNESSGLVVMLREKQKLRALRAANDGEKTQKPMDRRDGKRFRNATGNGESGT